MPGTLSQVAWAAVKTKGSYNGALYRRKKARGGPKQAIMAVQHALLVTIWHMFHMFHMFSRGACTRIWDRTTSSATTSNEECAT